MKLDKVVFFDESLENSFVKLDKSDSIKKAIIWALQEDAFSGRNVKKNLIPKSLIQKYGLTNLWIYNLPDGWRMLYVLTILEEIKIVVVVLYWMTHEDYKRLFNFI